MIYTHYGVAASDALTHVRPDLAATLRFAQTGDVVIAAVGETVEDVGKSVAWLGADRVAVHDDCFIFRSALDPKYVAYFTQSEAFNRPKELHVARAKVKCLSSSGLERLRMPVPPVELQREIVRILDGFAALEAEIEEELEARERQRLAFARTLPQAPYATALGSDATKLVRLGEVAKQYVEPVRVQSGETYTNLGVRWNGEGAFVRGSRLGSLIKGSTLFKVKPGQFIDNRMFVIEGSFAVVTPDLADGVVSSEFPVYFQDGYTLKRIAGEVTGVERGSTKSRRRWKEEQFGAFQIELPVRQRGSRAGRASSDRRWRAAPPARGGRARHRRPRATCHGGRPSQWSPVFNRESSNLGGFVEWVDPAAFNKSRGDGWPEVIARYNHDDKLLLGTVASGTLRLDIDGTGLLYETVPPTARADIIELVERGDVSKSSFAFRTMTDDWDTSDQAFPRRRLLSVQLVDVAPVNIPAYPGHHRRATVSRPA